ncbi:MAG: hypothetical protein ACYCZ2_05735 [Lutibacter sp.]|nr:MAG: hypothetical protein APF83_02605 [Lutibacter sp. BRH_c52]
MDLDDLFAGKNIQRKHHYKQKYNYSNERQFNWLNLFNKIKQNKKLRNIIIIGIAIILVIVIGLIILLFPYIVKLFNFIAEKGVSGLVELSKELLNKLTTSIKL